MRYDQDLYSLETVDGENVIQLDPETLSISFGKRMR